MIHSTQEPNYEPHINDIFAYLVSSLEYYYKFCVLCYQIVIYRKDIDPEIENIFQDILNKLKTIAYYTPSKPSDIWNIHLIEDIIHKPLKYKDTDAQDYFVTLTNENIKFVNDYKKEYDFIIPAKDEKIDTNCIKSQISRLYNINPNITCNPELKCTWYLLIGLFEYLSNSKSVKDNKLYTFDLFEIQNQSKVITDSMQRVLTLAQYKQKRS